MHIAYLRTLIRESPLTGFAVVVEYDMRLARGCSRYPSSLRPQIRSSLSTFNEPSTTARAVEKLCSWPRLMGLVLCGSHLLPDRALDLFRPIRSSYHLLIAFTSLRYACRRVKCRRIQPSNFRMGDICVGSILMLLHPAGGRRGYLLYLQSTSADCDSRLSR